MSARYTATGSARISRDFFHWGPVPEGFDVFIEIRDLSDKRSGHVYADGHHKVVVTGPAGSTRPRSKAFEGESAWSNAERYAGDAVTALQNQERAA